MYMRLIFVSLGILSLAIGTAYADVPNAPRAAIEDAIAPHATGGAAGYCSIFYYNFCRWMWAYSGFGAGNEVGVIFDLPLDCAMGAGEEYWNTDFWWYWRYTCPGRGYTISYNLYNLDAQRCKQGGSMGTVAHSDPTERWNHYAGLGGPIWSHYTSIIASFDKGGLPYMMTDNNVHDLADPTYCPGYVPHTVVHSVAWKYGPTVYCPPAAFTDGLGPVEILMDASFWSEISTRAESWTGVKRLFR